MSKYTYYKRKEAGICTRCGKEKAEENKTLCFSCLEKLKLAKRKDREFFISQGYCPRCGKNKLFGNEKNCPECLAKEAERKKHYKSNFDMKEYAKKRREVFKAKGICTQCQKRKAPIGRTTCEICSQRNAKRERERRIENGADTIPRSERRSYNLCYLCGKPLDKDGGLCMKCSEIVSKNLVQHKNLAWQKDNQFLCVKR